MELDKRSTKNGDVTLKIIFGHQEYGKIFLGLVKGYNEVNFIKPTIMKKSNRNININHTLSASILVEAFLFGTCCDIRFMYFSFSNAYEASKAQVMNSYHPKRYT